MKLLCWLLKESTDDPGSRGLLARLLGRDGQLASAIDFVHLQADTIPKKTPTWDCMSKEQDRLADKGWQLLGGAAAAPGGVCNPESPSVTPSQGQCTWQVLDSPRSLLHLLYGSWGFVQRQCLIFLLKLETDPEGTESSPFLTGRGNSAKGKAEVLGRKTLSKFASDLWSVRQHPVTTGRLSISSLASCNLCRICKELKEGTNHRRVDKSSYCYRVWLPWRNLAFKLGVFSLEKEL